MLIDVDYELELLGVNAAEAIAEVARDRDADEIVIGSRGFRGLRAALGSVSHDMLHLAHRPGSRDPLRGHPGAPRSAVVNAPLVIGYDGSEDAVNAIAGAGRLLSPRPALVVDSHVGLPPPALGPAGPDRPPGRGGEGP